MEHRKTLTLILALVGTSAALTSAILTKQILDLNLKIYKENNGKTNK